MDRNSLWSKVKTNDVKCKVSKIEILLFKKSNVWSLYLISISNHIISSAPQCDHYQFILTMTGTIFINSIHVTHLPRILCWDDLLSIIFYNFNETPKKLSRHQGKSGIQNTGSLIMHKAPAKNLIYKLYKLWSYA